MTNERAEVTLTWYDMTKLPEAGREVICLTEIDDEGMDNERYCITPHMYYFTAGTIVTVEHDPDFDAEYPGKKFINPEIRLYNAIFSNTNGDDLFEIEETGWYVEEWDNPKRLRQYRKLNSEYLKYWCYLTMPDGSELNYKANMM